jgi:DNA-binding response OmpR family regulator
MAAWIVVEDEPDLYDMMMAVYDTLGIDGIAFTTGEDAVDWIDAIDGGYISDQHPEVALLDIRLPGSVNGVEVGARLRSSSFKQKVKIILMTAHRLSVQEEMAAMHQAGADLILYKPFSPMTEIPKVMRDFAASL